MAVRRIPAPPTLMLEYLPGWGRFLDDQVAGRAPLDRDGMHDRVEELLRIALRRL